MEIIDVTVAPTKLSGKTAAKDFWGMAHRLGDMSELERIRSIKAGFPIYMADATKNTFRMTSQSVSELLNLSVTTYERRRRDSKPLDAAASERLDRVAAVALLAEDVFEDKTDAAVWLSSPNKALDGNTPVMHCETAIGAQQVRRILNALEWGGAA
ncbi:antitoxin [Alcaligenes faecalis]|uniref:Antitoxin n=1 Tax=Alcaligenes faecalis TaxID=511 RepID=A0A1Z3MKU4_ALCFA|nr:antitoxin Xre/MbcA/ParS toxin-binding domain-containing protein [Alcaligenes faecalis]ASD48408.1 antitoxin [Alcaligenes faecalis]OSZ33115.1 antitoxin [Alcaligenes faecalis]OSZ41175.1 antitoxin [Alcaligenes faecalis]